MKDLKKEALQELLGNIKRETLTKEEVSTVDTHYVERYESMFKIELMTQKVLFELIQKNKKNKDNIKRINKELKQSNITLNILSKIKKHLKEENMDLSKYNELLKKLEKSLIKRESIKEKNKDIV